VTANDNGFPNLNIACSKTVSVNVDPSQLRFQFDNYQATIPETEPVTNSVRDLDTIPNVRTALCVCVCVCVCVFVFCFCEMPRFGLNELLLLNDVTLVQCYSSMLC
jgi:hypothetical protein